MPKRAGADKTPENHNPLPRPALHRLNDVLASLFYIIWILIGAFFLLIIIGQIRQGALKSFVGKPAAQPAPQVQTPTETNLSGVGRVNIACVQESLTQATIQKLVVEGNTSSLTAEEKSKLDPCIIEAQSPSPS